MTSGYASAAPLYIAQGWQGVLPLPEGAKHPPPDGWTGREAAMPDERQVRKWAMTRPTANVALRLPRNVLGIDVDDYGDKPGAATLTELEARLGPLPPTVVSSARPLPSGIRLFAVPELPSWHNPGRGIDIVTWYHRYVAAWPSVHPTGATYTWLDQRTGELLDGPPALADLPALPAAWVKHLGSEHEGDAKAADPDMAALLTSLPDAPECPAMVTATARWVKEVTGGGQGDWRHDGMVQGSLALLRLGDEGHRGAREGLRTLLEAFSASVTADGTRTHTQASAEWARALRGAVAIVAAAPTDDEGDPCDSQGAAASAELDEMIGAQPAAKRRVVAAPGDPLSNARAFVATRHAHPEHPTLVCQGGMFSAWDGVTWRLLDEAGLRAGLYAWLEHADYWKPRKAKGQTVFDLEPFNPTRAKVGDLLDALSAATHLPGTVTAPSWLAGEGPADVLVTANGVLELGSRILHPHTPRLWTPLAVPYPFRPDAGPPRRWLIFLDQLWPNDPDSVDTLQEWFGYVLSGGMYLHKALFLIGPKRAGKGTIAGVLGGLVGREQVAGPTLEGIGAHFGLSQLLGKPLAVIADARLRQADDVVTERLLAITGQDVQTVDRKYRDPWTGVLPTRLLMLSNEVPRLADASGALASRFVVLQLQQSFAGREDHGLAAALEVEMPAILGWALDGLERLRARGRILQPESGLQAVRDMEELGSPVLAFVREECEVGPGKQVSAAALYDAWLEWCEVNHRTPSSVQAFGRDLRAAVLGLSMTNPRINGVPKRHYEGITLRHSVDRHLQSV